MANSSKPCTGVIFNMDGACMDPDCGRHGLDVEFGWDVEVRPRLARRKTRHECYLCCGSGYDSDGFFGMTYECSACNGTGWIEE